MSPKILVSERAKADRLVYNNKILQQLLNYNKPYHWEHPDPRHK